MSFVPSTGCNKIKPILVVNSHPIQYFAPLYRQLSATIPLTVLYCSRHGLGGEVDRQFGTPVKWDISLLEGYTYKFLSNQSIKPSIYSFWGLFNLSVIKELWQAPESIVLVHGWGYSVCWVAIIFAKLFGHTVCLRGESPVRLELRKSQCTQRVRKFLLGRGLFKFIDHFLYIGQQNKKFYEHMAVRSEQLIFCPYAVDNERFQKQALQLHVDQPILRRQINVPVDAFVILYSGKYINKKRPLDLLRAFDQLAAPNKLLILMGDGILRNELEQYIADHGLKNVLLTGFVNQRTIVNYYAVADAYVMCSDEEETWGLSTNEAMNFSLPVVLTKTVGCADDLLLENQNGYGVTCGDLQGLTHALHKLYSNTPLARQQMGKRSSEHIQQYSYTQVVQSLNKLAAA